MWVTADLAAVLLDSGAGGRELAVVAGALWSACLAALAGPGPRLSTEREPKAVTTATLEALIGADPKKRVEAARAVAPGGPWRAVALQVELAAESRALFWFDGPSGLLLADGVEPEGFEWTPTTASYLGRLLQRLAEKGSPS